MTPDLQVTHDFKMDFQKQTAIKITFPTDKKSKIKPTYLVPKEYSVVDGDTLTSIAETQKTTVQRLWEKNTSLTNPDLINPGDKLVIPEDAETLTPRPLPESKPLFVAVNLNSTSNPNPLPATAVVPRGAVDGNTYTPGYCTWYVKNRRPDLPNNLGNADTWTYRAAQQGIPTGYAPRAGAVGQMGMHVVYVESVNADGTFNLSEMNYQGLWITSGRQNVSPAGWSFIY